VLFMLKADGGFDFELFWQLADKKINATKE
jgi:hypothetical protein